MKPTVESTFGDGESASTVSSRGRSAENPYESIAASETHSPGGSFLLIRLAVSAAVLVASIIISHALMFGCAIALAGYLIPGPFQFADVMSSPLGPWVKMGSLICLPVCLAMSVYCYGRIARTQRALSETLARRNELHRQLQELRSDYAAIERSQRGASGNIRNEGA